jgi:hypothetical protein
MTFVITGVYILVLFGVGMFFARRESRERHEQEKEGHSSPLSSIWHGTERRTGEDRRREVALSR